MVISDTTHQRSLARLGQFDWSTNQTRRHLLQYKMKRLSPGKKQSTSVVGVRRSHDGGLLGTLRRILQRKKAPAVQVGMDDDRTGASTAAALAPSTTETRASADDRAAQSRRPSHTMSRIGAPHHLQVRVSSRDAASEAHAKALHVEKNEEWEEEEEEADDDGDDDDASDQERRARGDSSPVPRSRAGKEKRVKPKRGKNRWVRQLLTQVEKTKDRVHTKATKKYRRHPVAATGSSLSAPPTFFITTDGLHSLLVARILLFLDVRQPVAGVARVNKAFGVHVRVFYEIYCPHPRPQRYLAQKLFNSVASARDSTERQQLAGSGISATVLSFLSVSERVRASSCCRTLYNGCNSLPLVISGAEQARRFVNCMAAKLAHARFIATTQLRLGTSAVFRVAMMRNVLRQGCVGAQQFARLLATHPEDMDADDAVAVVRLLDTDGCECFPVLSELLLIRVRDFAEELFVQFVQVLFTDRVSHKLQTLELSGAPSPTIPTD